jgi:hypothetical protein
MDTADEQQKARWDSFMRGGMRVRQVAMQAPGVRVVARGAAAMR